MPVACLRIPHFSLRIRLLDQPELDGLPLVLTTPSRSRTAVADCTPEAAQRGIRPGMLVREVTTLCPEALFFSPNPVRESAIFERILTGLETFSPLVEPAAPGCCYLDLHGLARHDASPEAAAERLLRHVSPVLRPRVGLAPGKFAALVAAQQAPAGGSRIVAAEDIMAFLAPVSVSWLPISPPVVRRLERLGLSTLGAIAALPVTAMQARFGPEGRHIWQLASGQDDTSVQARTVPAEVIEELTLPAPSTSRDMVLTGLRQLVQRAFRRPELHHRHVRQARVQILIEENRSVEHELTFREPLGRARIAEVLTLRLQNLELPGAAEALRLKLIGLTTETALQALLPGLKPRQLRPLAEAARQLKRRYGVSPLYHIVEVEPWSRIPERRRALISYDP